VLTLGCLFPSGHHFFGLDPTYREEHLRQFYILMKHLHFSYADLHRLPVRYRNWFIDRLVKDMNPEANKTKVGNLELDDDTPISQVLGKLDKYD
jgi:hypothetical protein